jgi:hypothetical protein
MEGRRRELGGEGERGADAGVLPGSATVPVPLPVFAVEEQVGVNAEVQPRGDLRLRSLSPLSFPFHPSLTSDPLDPACTSTTLPSFTLSRRPLVLSRRSAVENRSVGRVSLPSGSLGWTAQRLAAASEQGTQTFSLSSRSSYHVLTSFRVLFSSIKTTLDLFRSSRPRPRFLLSLLDLTLHTIDLTILPLSRLSPHLVQLRRPSRRLLESDFVVFSPNTPSARRRSIDTSSPHYRSTYSSRRRRLEYRMPHFLSC